MYYVVMIDSFMSGWGKAEGKENVLIFECETKDEAKVVYDNANSRSDMRDVEIVEQYENYNEDEYLVQFFTYDSPYSSFYEEGYFAKGSKSQ